MAQKIAGPSLRFERELQREGHLVVAGVDEAGRGSWAGPVVAAAVVLPFLNRYYGITDSKLLSPIQRERLLEKIYDIAAGVGVGVVENSEVDQLGIGQASYLAMRRAVANLPMDPSFVLVDGFKVGFAGVPSRGVIGGDRKSVSIAAASIVAKVARDRMMDMIHVDSPEYGFLTNRGYGTRFHQLMIKQHGVSRWHRKSFRPVQASIGGRANLAMS